MMLSKSAPALATACTCAAGSAACNPDYTTQAASLAACNSAASAAGQTACIQYSAFKCPDQKYDGVTATFFPFYPTGCSTSPFIGEDGECLDSDPNLCEGVNKMRILDQQGFLDSCVDTSPPDPNQCTQVFGMSEGITLCDDARAQCEATGGSFGYAGAGENMDPICTTPDASVPLCSSGSMLMVDLGGGDGAFACSPPDELSIEICDSPLYDCDGDGNIDDQNQNGLTDNGTADTGQATGGGSGVADAGEGLNVGFDEFEVQTTGSGQCDPTSTNYA
jgi:hypothetical protein